MLVRTCNSPVAKLPREYWRPPTAFPLFSVMGNSASHQLLFTGACMGHGTQPVLAAIWVQGQSLSAGHPAGRVGAGAFSHTESSRQPPLADSLHEGQELFASTAHSCRRSCVAKCAHLTFSRAWGWDLCSLPWGVYPASCRWFLLPLMSVPSSHPTAAALWQELRHRRARDGTDM